MERIIYCDYFCCEYYEEGICTSVELHLGFRDVCRECKISDEKIEKHLEAQKKKVGKKEYGESRLTPKAYRIR